MSRDTRSARTVVRRIPRAAFLFLALFTCGLTGSSCQRKSRFVPLQADSTAVGSDSAAVRMREAQGAWESGDQERAAEISALALYADLRSRPHEEWVGRATALLDSLAIGAELAGAPCALVANFFPRADPGAGSWPYLFTCDEQEAAFQGIEGKGLRLSGVATRNLTPDKPAKGKPPGAAVLFGRRVGGGIQPLLMVWERTGNRGWKLVQTLGPDSLGGAGTGEFAADDSTTVLVTRTYRTPASFEECATCPHLYVVGRFRWNPSGFQRIERAEVASPYASFVRLIRALTSGDREAAERVVADQSVLDEALSLGWDRVRGTWRVAPGTDETPQQMTFYRGSQEAYRVHFEPREGDWLVSGFESVPRAVE